MSWSKRQLIEAAFSEIGLAASSYDLQPDQLEDAMRRLDVMMETWNGRGIRLGYPIPSTPEDSDLDTESGVPDYANEAIILGLAMRLAPGFGKTVSADTKQNARSAYSFMMSRNVKPIPRQAIGTMPMGAGHKGAYGVFAEEPVDTLDVGSDAELEFE